VTVKHELLQKLKHCLNQAVVQNEHLIEKNVN